MLTLFLQTILAEFCEALLGNGEVAGRSEDGWSQPHKFLSPTTLKMTLGILLVFVFVVASLHLKLLLQEMAPVAYVLYCTLNCLCIVHACLISMVLLPVIYTVHFLF